MESLCSVVVFLLRGVAELDASAAAAVDFPIFEFHHFVDQRIEMTFAGEHIHNVRIVQDTLKHKAEVVQRLCRARHRFGWLNSETSSVAWVIARVPDRPRWRQRADCPLLLSE